MIRAALKLGLIGLAVCIAAFATRRAFLGGVMPVSWDQEPPKTGALEAAFLLLSIENIVAVVAAIALTFAAVLWYKRRAQTRH